MNTCQTLVLSVVFLAIGPTVHAASPLNPCTDKVFTPDGDIQEFVNLAGDSQDYFITDPMDPDFGLLRPGAELTIGVTMAVDTQPSSGKFPAGPTGFRDLPAVGPGPQLPTGFNIGRVFSSYNPESDMYFLAMDISAPAAMDTVAGTHPIAFDIDGDGSRATQTEIVPDVVSEAPSVVDDQYGFRIDTDGDQIGDVRITIGEVAGGAIPFGSVAIDPGGAPQMIDGVTVRRIVFFEDLTGTLPAPPHDLARVFLDYNQDGLLDYRDVGVDDDIEIAILHVGLLPSNTHPASATFRATADSFDDSPLGGGVEETVNFGAISPEDACDDDGDGVFNNQDACANTPTGTAVDALGRPRGDLDLDCDTDLRDLAHVQTGFTGPGEDFGG